MAFRKEKREWVTCVGEVLLTPEEVARDRLKIGRTRVFELIARGELRSISIGRSRRVPASAVDAYIERLQAEQAEGYS